MRVVVVVVVVVVVEVVAVVVDSESSERVGTKLGFWKYRSRRCRLLLCLSH